MAACVVAGMPKVYAPLVRTLAPDSRAIERDAGSGLSPLETAAAGPT